MIHTTSAPTVHKVSFLSEGEPMAGNLFYPPDYQKGTSYPTVIVGGSWTTVKEQMAGLYARRLAAQGFITLAFDYRNFGESGGVPRFFESPEKKIRDLKSVVDFIEKAEGVDKESIAMLAICASSGYMARATAEDSRVKALVTVAAWLHDMEAVKLIYGGQEGVDRRLSAARAAKKNYALTGEVEYIPAISNTDPSAAMYGNFEYYLNPNRGRIREWSAEQFAVMSWEDWLTFNPMLVAGNIKVPVLMIHSDEAVLPDYTKRFFEQIPHQPKQLYWTQGSQFDFYDQPKQVNEALAQATSFLHENL